MTTPQSPHLVLIVDDDPTTCALTATILEREGYRTRSCSSGRDALAAVEKEPVALVLLDVIMPGMDGFEVCARLRETEKGKRLPVILLTGRDDVDTRLEGMQSGVSEFLAKPVTRHELLARVRAQLHIVDLTRQLETVEDNLKQRTGAPAPATR
ncbi:MAG TPA: response regulator [Candidatus Eisenbacteria bacterium]|nr:response regulator [Candidatus Eisenbacteria bacterium]